MAFTEKWVASLKPKKSAYIVYENGSDPGFCIRVYPSGTRTFYQQYTFRLPGAKGPGRREFLPLGSWPDMTLARARMRARNARAKIEEGVDPKGPNQSRKSQIGNGSGRHLFDAYTAHMKSAGMRSWQVRAWAIEKDAMPIIQGKSANKVSAHDIRQILYNIIKRGAEPQANRVRSYLSAMFAWGMRHDNDPRSLGAPVLFGIAHNPVSAVPKNADAESVGERVLSWGELRAVWEGNGLPEPYRIMLRLIIATGGQRPGEIIEAPRSEISHSQWIVAASRSKNKQDHLIPVTPMIRSLLDAVYAIYGDSEWIFPAKHVSSAEEPIRVQSLSRRIVEFVTDSEMAPWTPRDLRRTCKTLMGEIGVDKFTRDRLQNHAINDVSGRHYDRYSYLIEKRDALLKWEDTITKCFELGQ